MSEENGMALVKWLSVFCSVFVVMESCHANGIPSVKKVYMMSLYVERTSAVRV